MKVWLNIQEVSDYLGAQQSIISGLVSKNKIPFSKKYEILCFNREEIDQWMRTPEENDATPGCDETPDLLYKDLLLKEKPLAASMILGGQKQWARIEDFIKESAKIALQKKKDFLCRVISSSWR